MGNLPYFLQNKQKSKSKNQKKKKKSRCARMGSFPLIPPSLPLTLSSFKIGKVGGERGKKREGKRRRGVGGFG